MSWLDILPSSERMKIRKRMRSPEAYAETREKIKSVEQIAEEMERNEAVAELKFLIETEPMVKEALKKQVQEDFREQGIDAVVEGASEDVSQAIEKGNFEVVMDAEQLAVVPEGNITEKLPLKKSLGEQYVGQFVQEM